ncbi:MAG TPA: hypothetical protein PLB16_05725 [bacterium]|nr:hypothetical protein [bacterium]
MKIFKKGEIVTVTMLTRLFKDFKRRINEVTSRQVNVLTTGQIIDIGTIGTDTIIVTPMSTANEQFFQTSLLPVYTIGTDSIKKGGNSYLIYYIDEIEKIDKIGEL